MGSTYGFHSEKLDSDFEISGDDYYETVDGYTDDSDILYDYGEPVRSLREFLRTYVSSV